MAFCKMAPYFFHDAGLEWSYLCPGEFKSRCDGHRHLEEGIPSLTPDGPTALQEKGDQVPCDTAMERKMSS